MELSVGLMLILLGILNLSGMMRRITETVTSLQPGQHSHPTDMVTTFTAIRTATALKKKKNGRGTPSRGDANNP